MTGQGHQRHREKNTPKAVLSWQSIASRLAYRCLDQLEVTTLPVPVERLLDNPPDALAGKYRVVRCAGAVDAVQTRAENVIYLDVSQPADVQRVGMAQALGQVLLKTDAAVELSLAQRLNGASGLDFAERFAYELLMPFEWLAAFKPELQPEGVQARSLEQIAQRFGVPLAFVERFMVSAAVESGARTGCDGCRIHTAAKAAADFVHKKGSYAQLRAAIREASPI